jgi:hypothetical protein
VREREREMWRSRQKERKVKCSLNENELRKVAEVGEQQRKHVN